MWFEIGSIWWLKLFKIKAITIGCLIFYSSSVEQTPYVVRRHEIKHAEQYERLGIDGFIKEYSYQFIYNLLIGMEPFEAYENISLELEAEEAEVCKKECIRFK